MGWEGLRTDKEAYKASQDIEDGAGKWNIKIGSHATHIAKIVWISFRHFHYNKNQQFKGESNPKLIQAIPRKQSFIYIRQSI